jgi:hypothetical protein
MRWTFLNLSLAILALIASFIITGCAEEEIVTESPLRVIWTMPSNGFDGMPESIRIQFNRIIEASTINNAITISPSLGKIDQRRSS